MARFLLFFRSSYQEPSTEHLAGMFFLFFPFVTGRDSRKNYEYIFLGIRNQTFAYELKILHKTLEQELIS